MFHDHITAKPPIKPAAVPPFVPSLVANSVDDWLRHINQLLTREKTNSIDLGRLLHDAKRSLRYGEWSQLWRSGAPGGLAISKRKAEMLVVVGRNLGTLDAQTSAQLPYAWNTLYYLALLERRPLVELIREAVVSPSITLQEAKALLPPRRARNGSRRNFKRLLAKLRGFLEANSPQWSVAERECVRAELLSLAATVATPLPEALSA
jgi:hypothetical protein